MSDSLDAAISALMADVRTSQAQRDELRVILQPLLDGPTAEFDADSFYCLFCGTVGGRRETIHHASDCPVLRRDIILGRTAWAGR